MNEAVSNFSIAITDNYRIDRFQDSDASRILEIVNTKDECLLKYMACLQKIKNISDAQSFARYNYIEWNRGRSYAIRDNNLLIGEIGLKSVHELNDIPEMFYWITPEYRGKGIACRAVEKMTEYAFANYDCNKLVIRVELENTASNGVAKKSGYEFKGQRFSRVLKLEYYLWEKTKIELAA